MNLERAASGAHQKNQQKNQRAEPGLHCSPAWVCSLQLRLGLLSIGVNETDLVSVLALGEGRRPK